MGYADLGLRGKPRAFVSVDLDPVDAHLAGYGFDTNLCDLIYRASIPRILDLLDKVHLKATFFFVARDAQREASILKEIVACGHEVASHSFTHPVPFGLLPPDRLRAELSRSRQELEDVTGRPVLGFRAPGWEVSSSIMREVARAGYRYDASVFPSPGLIGARLLRVLASRGRVRKLLVGSSLKTALSKPYPYKVASEDNGLWEFPVAVSPRLRIPFLHTTWYLMPPSLCWAVYRACRRAGHALSYQFHAADLLDLNGDHVDPRMARHPGMKLPLERKRALLEVVLATIAADYTVSTYAEAVNRG